MKKSIFTGFSLFFLTAGIITLSHTNTFAAEQPDAVSLLSSYFSSNLTDIPLEALEAEEKEILPTKIEI